MAHPVLARRVASMGALDDAGLRCHAFGHPWNRPPLVRFNYWGFDARLLLLRCSSCGTERRDIRDGANPAKLITRLYRYPHDYLVAFPASRGDFLAEWFARHDTPPADVEDWTAWAA